MEMESTNLLLLQKACRNSLKVKLIFENEVDFCTISKKKCLVKYITELQMFFVY